MKLLAQELRALDAELRGRRTPRDRAVAGYLAYRCRSWAASVESGRPESIARALAAAETGLVEARARRLTPAPYEVDAYETAIRILGRATAALEAA